MVIGELVASGILKLFGDDDDEPSHPSYRVLPRFGNDD